jgi:hypothetical protein
MRSIRRRKGGRSFPTAGGREIAEVKGGGVPVTLGDELPHVRGRERATGVTRGRAGVASAQNVPLARRGRAGSRGRYSIAGHRKLIADRV